MNSIAEEIKARIDIVNLIAEYVDLKRAGQNYKGLCPFHSEKTPSFMVSPSKQIFHCFGCNKGGDIFGFVMNYENMTFPEAVSYLADKAGIKLEDRGQESEVRRGLKEVLFAIQKEAMIFFQNNLKISKQSVSYLKERGVNNEIIEKFSLGYSKNEKEALFNHLKKQGFPLEHIKASGLVNFSEPTSGMGVYDFFRDRLMFPIFDLQGRAVAFGGRILSAFLKDLPKYINSPDSVIFKKGDFNYGLDMAKSSIIQKGYSIIVEGYMDAIICHQYGFNNTIAPLGTALTPGQLRRLKRFSDKALLIFDGDTAGISATKRSVELCYGEGMIVKILPLPEGEDPDTFIRRHGEGHFRKQIGRAISPVEFLLKVSSNKLDAVRYLLTILTSCPDSLQREETLRELSFRSGINELTLREELRSISQKRQKTEDRRQKTENRKQRSDHQDTALQSLSELYKEEKILLNIALSMPEKAVAIANKIDTGIIQNPIIRGIFEKIKAFLANGDKYLSMEGLFNICSSEEQKMITKLSMNPEVDEEYIDENIRDCLKKLSIRNLERQIKEAERIGDERLLHFLLSKRKKITQKRLTGEFF